MSRRLMSFHRFLLSPADTAIITDPFCLSVFGTILSTTGIIGAHKFLIEFLPGFVPPRFYARKVPPLNQDYVDEQITVLMELGFIRPSTYPSCCPVHVANVNSPNRRMTIGVVGSAGPITDMRSILVYFKGKRYFIRSLRLLANHYG
jgi:hypothetical protein